MEYAASITIPHPLRLRWRMIYGRHDTVANMGMNEVSDRVVMHYRPQRSNHGSTANGMAGPRVGTGDPCHNFRRLHDWVHTDLAKGITLFPCMEHSRGRGNIVRSSGDAP